ncbi:MAG: DUF4445 domain-containing protein, partial [Acidobacteria bacterium]|nr:DUF4445 domain-containing protein [Acidobacteriota bacterium]
STMRDLFFNLDVQSIGQRPYRSLTEQEWLDRTRPGTSLVEYAHRLGIWAHPKARVWSPPLVASHVGADTTAALVAIGMERQREVVMLVDIGTNTEVVVGNGESMIAASCPAGPAFEGGLVKYGMTGSEGAIESVRLRGGRFECRTIGGGEPQGICGSGLIDLLAELRRHGRMTPKGVFADRSYEFTLAPGAGGCPGITFSREDASHLAQAKSANYCGQFLVMREYGVSPAEITRLYLAGGFANFVDPASAVEIGFLAPVAAGRIVKAGNASLAGARRMLLSRGQRETAGRLVKRVRHLELETMPDFFEVFVEGCQFKPMPAVSPAGVAR